MMIEVNRRTLLVGIAATTLLIGDALAATKPATLTLYAPDKRAISVWSWKGRGRHAGTIVFSHGALSAPWTYAPIIEPWVAAGFDVLAPLHVDSVYHPKTKDFDGLKSWRARIEDMRALSAHVGKRGYVAAGHSYGGLTALAMGGAEALIPEGVTGPLRDPAVTRVIAFSPPGPLPPLIDAAGYARLAVPALVQTGTRDLQPLYVEGDAWRKHLVAYDAATAGNHRYSLILEGADHYFGGATCDATKPGPPQEQLLASAVEISLLFLRSTSKSADFAAIDARLSDVGPIQLRRK